jgi:TonB-dependent SusC/RagA subfamily outer membrane receptor
MSSPARLARATLALGLLFGFLHGCAQKSATNGDDPADAAKPDAAEAKAPESDAAEPDSWEETRPRDPNTVTAEDIQRHPGEPIEEILAGRIAGVEVERTPNGLKVRIRGAGPGGALVGITPYDIESITVLKDPAETAIYGVRGANGVIVIRTKDP